MDPVLFYVDHTARFERNTGIQRCVRSLSRALIEIGVRLQPVIWNHRHHRLETAGPRQRGHLAHWYGPAPGDWLDASQGSPAPLVKARWLIIPELVSGPHNPSASELTRETARLGLKVAWLFHDAIPVRWAHLYGQQASQAARAHTEYMSGLAQFDLVLANSRTTAQHLKQFWADQQLQVLAELHAVPLAEELPGTARLPPIGDPNDAKILLCVGSLEPRKNHGALLKALAALVAEQRWPQQLTLVIVGWPNDARVVAQVKRATALGLPVRWEADANDSRLLELYSQSVACVYPSLEEGFGLPVAESLWHQRPCLCSDRGALAELAAGGGCLTVDTRSWQAIQAGLLAISTDLTLRTKLQEQITKRPIRTWRQVATDWHGALMSHQH